MFSDRFRMTDLVSDIMTRTVLTVRPDQPLADLFSLFANHGVHHVLVVERDTVVGVISDRDLFRALLVNEDAETVPVTRIMKAPAVTVTSAASLDEAARHLLEHRIHCLPVVDAKARLAGILTTSDLLRTLAGPDASPLR